MGYFPRLCIGTFFVLALQARAQRTAPRQRLDGQTDGLSDAEFLEGIASVVQKGYVRQGKELMKTKANLIKSCKQSIAEPLPFGKDDEAADFDRRIRADYCDALSDMKAFTERYINTIESSMKAKQLVCALVDLILKDETIGEDAQFFINADGTPATKRDIRVMRRFHLQSLLLGALHFAAVSRLDNTVGSETYDIWCPEPLSKGAQRKYGGGMGKDLMKDISVVAIEVSEPEQLPVAAPTAEDEKLESTEVRNQKATQIATNPISMVQYGEKSIMTQTFNGNVTFN